MYFSDRFHYSYFSLQILTESTLHVAWMYALFLRPASHQSQRKNPSLIHEREERMNGECVYNSVANIGKIIYLISVTRLRVVGFSKPASFALSFSKATSFAISFSFSAAICPHFSVLFATRLYFRWLRMKSSTTQRSRNVFKVGYFFTT